jgi:DNA-binding PucR family transcriptional regulator
VELAQAAARRLNEASPVAVTVGAVGPLLDLGQVSGAERQARRCAKALLSLGRAGQGGTPDELGIYGLLLSEADREQVQCLLVGTLGALEQYDAQRGTVLLKTVERYFQHDGNAAHTASSLFVHVNTLYQRLDRVDAILGPTWRHGDRALEIRLALRLRRLELGGEHSGATLTV